MERNFSSVCLVVYSIALSIAFPSKAYKSDTRIKDKSTLSTEQLKSIPFSRQKRPFSANMVFRVSLSVYIKS